MKKQNKNKTSFLASFKNMFKGRKVNEVVNNLEEEVILTPTQVIMRNFFSNKFAIIGIVLFLGITSFSFLGSQIYQVKPTYTEPVLRNIRPGIGYLDVPGELKENGVADIQSGVAFSVGLDNDGNIYAWGSDVQGSMDIPEEMFDRKYEQIAVGDRHVIALGKDGMVYGWGYNSFGQAELPSDILMSLKGQPISKVYAGEAYSAIITKDNRLFVWGSVMNSGLDVIPKDIQGSIVDVTCSTYNMVVLLEDGTVRVLGVSGNEISDVPTELTDGSITVEAIAMSYRNGLALDSNGEVHVWGAESYGLLNIPEIDAEVTMISGAKNALYAVDENSVIHAWGDDTLHELDVPTMENIENIYTGFFTMFVESETGEVKSWGNNGYLFGTDEQGRDMFTRLMYGGTVTLSVGVIAAVISTIIGLLVGMIAGFVGGRVDNFLMRIGEIVMSIPFMPIVITLSSIVATTMSSSQRMTLIMVILGLLSWPGLARLVRGQILVEREKDFVLAARALGVKETRIVISHVLPNVISICIVNMTLSYAGFMLTESGLSFLGFGVANPQASWGNMLNSVVSSEIIENYWWRWVLPAMCVVIAAISINLIGTALSDAIDPKANEK